MLTISPLANKLVASNGVRLSGMTLAVWFWAIYVLAILFGVWSNYEAGQPVWFRRAGAYGILWLLVGMLGWHVFGAAIK